MMHFPFIRTTGSSRTNPSGAMRHLPCKGRLMFPLKGGMSRSDKGVLGGFLMSPPQHSLRTPPGQQRPTHLPCKGRFMFPLHGGTSRSDKGVPVNDAFPVYPYNGQLPHEPLCHLR